MVDRAINGGTSQEQEKGDPTEAVDVAREGHRRLAVTLLRRHEGRCPQDRARLRQLLVGRIVTLLVDEPEVEELGNVVEPAAFAKVHVARLQISVHEATSVRFA